jgi:hypothetical protein
MDERDPNLDTEFKRIEAFLWSLFSAIFTILFFLFLLIYLSA